MPSEWHFNYLSGTAISHSSHAGALYKWLSSNGLNVLLKDFLVNESELRLQQSAISENEKSENEGNT
eukprot:5972764-Amphidinium_carterae.1